MGFFSLFFDGFVIFSNVVVQIRSSLAYMRIRISPRVGVGFPDSPGGGGGGEQGFGGCGNPETGAIDLPFGGTTSHRKGIKVNSLCL